MKICCSHCLKLKVERSKVYWWALAKSKENEEYCPGPIQIWHQSQTGRAAIHPNTSTMHVKGCCKICALSGIRALLADFAEVPSPHHAPELDQGVVDDDDLSARPLWKGAGRCTSQVESGRLGRLQCLSTSMLDGWVEILSRPQANS